MYLGIDVYKRYAQVAVMNEAGEIVDEVRVKSDLHNFCAFLGVRENQARQSLPILQPLLHDLAD